MHMFVLKVYCSLEKFITQRNSLLKSCYTVVIFSNVVNCFAIICRVRLQFLVLKKYICSVSEYSLQTYKQNTVIL